MLRADASGVMETCGRQTVPRLYGLALRHGAPMVVWLALPAVVTRWADGRGGHVPLWLLGERVDTALALVWCFGLYIWIRLATRWAQSSHRLADVRLTPQAAAAVTTNLRPGERWRATTLLMALPSDDVTGILFCAMAVLWVVFVVPSVAYQFLLAGNDAFGWHLPVMLALGAFVLVRAVNPDPRRFVPVGIAAMALALLPTVLSADIHNRPIPGWLDGYRNAGYAIVLLVVALRRLANRGVSRQPSLLAITDRRALILDWLPARATAGQEELRVAAEWGPGSVAALQCRLTDGRLSAPGADGAPHVWSVGADVREVEAELRAHGLLPADSAAPAWPAALHHAAVWACLALLVVTTAADLAGVIGSAAACQYVAIPSMGATFTAAYAGRPLPSMDEFTTVARLRPHDAVLQGVYAQTLETQHRLDAAVTAWHGVQRLAGGGKLRDAADEGLRRIAAGTPLPVARPAPR